MTGSASAALFPMLRDAGMALLAVAVALWLRPWRGLGRGGPPWPWVMACAFMPVLWFLDRLVGVSGLPTMSLAPLVVLMAGWPVAVLALLPAGIVAALGTDIGSGEVLHRLVWMGLVPATLTLMLGAASRRWLPRHILVYIFVRGFFGIFVATLLAGTAMQWVSAAPTVADPMVSFIARVLMSFSEAFICGLLIATLVVFRPLLLATYSDSLYMPR